MGVSQAGQIVGLLITPKLGSLFSMFWPFGPLLACAVLAIICLSGYGLALCIRPPLAIAEEESVLAD